MAPTFGVVWRNQQHLRVLEQSGVIYRVCWLSVTYFMLKPRGTISARPWPNISYISNEVALASAYSDIAEKLAALGIQLQAQVQPPECDISAMSTNVVDHAQLATEGQSMYSSLNQGQREAVNEILIALRVAHSGYYLIDAPSGSGKTYLHNTLYNIAVGEKRRIVCVAWTASQPAYFHGGAISIQYSS